MNFKIEQYIIEQLAAYGFAILSARIAFMLRPDIWATRFNCGTDFNSAKRDRCLESLGMKSLEIQLNDRDDWMVVAFRSQDALTERIEWITGERVTALRPIVAARPAPAAVADADPNPIPNWACSERTERLAAAGITEDPSFKQPSRFAPRRSSL